MLLRLEKSWVSHFSVFIVEQIRESNFVRAAGVITQFVERVVVGVADEELGNDMNTDDSCDVGHATVRHSEPEALFDEAVQVHVELQRSVDVGFHHELRFERESFADFESFAYSEVIVPFFRSDVNVFDDVTVNVHINVVVDKSGDGEACIEFRGVVKDTETEVRGENVFSVGSEVGVVGVGDVEVGEAFALEVYAAVEAEAEVSVFAGFSPVSEAEVNEVTVEMSDVFVEDTEAEAESVFVDWAVHSERGCDRSSCEAYPLLSVESRNGEGVFVAGVGRVNEHFVEHVLGKHGIVLSLCRRGRGKEEYCVESGCCYDDEFFHD